MKKRIMAIMTIAILAIAGCGEGSEEAKELLQRILQLVGIPQNIVVKVCQDNNGNGLCGTDEVLAKLSINKGDSIEDIWQKIQFDSANTYWLDQIDPSKKLLLVMQDTDNVRYDAGQFTLPFTINSSREVNATKELSILEAMVDSSYLNSSEVVAVKEMNFVDKFYDVLLKDLMKNFNTLKDKTLSSTTSILANIQFMAEELRKKGISKTLPESVNACGNDEACVDAIINEIFKDLEISESEATIIAQREKGNSEENQLSNNDTTLLYLTKVTREDKLYGDNEEDVDTYSYDNKHRLKFDDCTIKYDSQDRITETVCQDTEYINGYNGETRTTTNKSLFSYNQYGLTKWEAYENGTLNWEYTVLAWQGDKPTKIEWRDNDTEEGWTTLTSKITYSGEMPSHIEAYTDTGVKWSIDQEFDNKNNPYRSFDKAFGGFHFFTSQNIFGGYSKNNLIKQTISTTMNMEEAEYNNKTVYTFDISYNRDQYPIKMDWYTQANDTKTLTSTTTYEYE